MIFRIVSYRLKNDTELLIQVKEVDGMFLLPLDFQQFRKLCELQEFYTILESKSKDALLCMSAALHKVVQNFSTYLCYFILIVSFCPCCLQVYFMKLGDDSFDDFVKINIRLHNYPQSMIALKNLKAAYIGKNDIPLYICSLSIN